MLLNTVTCLMHLTKENYSPAVMKQEVQHELYQVSHQDCHVSSHRISPADWGHRVHTLPHSCPILTQVCVYSSMLVAYRIF